VADEAEVDVELGEGAKVAPLIQDKLAGGSRRAPLGGMVGMVAGLVVVPMLATLIPYIWAKVTGAPITAPAASYWGWVTLAQIGAAVFGWEVGMQLGQRRHYARYLDALAARGTPRRLVTRFRLMDEGLHVESDRASHLAHWPSLLQIEPAETHWLIQSDTLTIALPRRAFASPDDERSFIAGLLAHMTPAARERSAAAVKFTAG